MSVSQALAAPVTLYYDTNGATGGTSTSSTQNFTDSVWSLSSTGILPTTGYLTGSDIVFSADDGVNVGAGTQSVTVQDTESTDGFTFNNGTVTLYGSGSPNLSIGAGGITVNSTDGATTFDSSLGTVTLSADQSWNNDSSQALNINSNVTASGNPNKLTFDGSGTGNVNINGALSGNLNVTQDSASSALYLNNNGNNFTGTITADGGAVVIGAGGAYGNSSVYLENEGTLEFGSGMSPNASIVVGPGGGQIDAGVVGVSGVDIFYNGSITGSAPGAVLNVLGGDFIPNSNVAATNIGTINVEGGRLLAYASGIFTGNSAFNVSSGAILDTRVGGTLGNAITLKNGSALENRSGGVSYTDVTLPTGSDATVTLGADDVGGGSITTNGPTINLANGTTLTLDINENHNDNTYNSDTVVYLDQAITGSGALTMTLIPGVYNEGTVVLGGNNNYSGPTTLNGVSVYPGSNGFGTSTVTMNSAAIETTGGTLSNHLIVNPGNSYINMANSNDQAISGPIELSASGAQLIVTNRTTGNLTFGNITYDSAGGNYVAFDGENGGGEIILNGIYTTPVGSSETMSFGGGDYMGSEQNANYYLGPDADFTNFQLNNYGGGSTISLSAGNLYIDTSKFTAGESLAVVNNAGDNHTVDIVGSQNIPLYLYTQEKYGPAPIGQWTMAQTTADSSVWSGYVLQNDTSLIVSAVAGGRLTFTNDIGGSGPAGVIKTGAGVVVFGDPNGNDYGTYNGDPGTTSGITTAPFVIDIQQGTLLVNNSQGYGLGSSSGNVNVEKGATLGGSNTLAPGQTVVSEDAGSIIAPGDAGQASLGIAPTIGTINLTGGLTTANNADPTTDGVTLDFKLNGYADGSGTPVNTPGVNNDFITVTNLTLNGTVTINLTAIGTAPLLTGYGNEYILMEGHGFTWSGNPTFVINTPDGYALDPSFGIGADYGLGYEFLTRASGQFLVIQLIAVPEPSTYGLLGLGLLALVAIGRFRRLRPVE